MFIAPTTREAMKDVPPTVRVVTTVDLFDRRQNPETGAEEFAEAADLALTEALKNGYRSVSFDSVSQFIKMIDNETVCEYVWMFSAWDKDEEGS
ncbi:hypothetical protein G7068_03370 [Leucobacter viscericola]|uniref:Uncharacterized protein n=1 Tax=Leucobacter viscericola TaxID=2714935 RepID=A0A6G7XCR7_9MICO|nr:hypothetical protein [Leucobacter viscericola]QIK62355.1 hypothetical protein G7068_03370 [Leucobacter viscericola]